MALMKAQITLPADFDQILQERIHREVVRVMNETKQQPMQKS